MLIEKCSQSISDSKGFTTTVSERTIREDIRILRSDILGFNAPIVFDDGAYHYSEKDFSIFNTPIYQKELLIDIQNLLVDNLKLLDNKKLPYLLQELSKITGENVSKTLFDDKKFNSENKPSKDSSIFEKRMPNKYLEEWFIYKNKLKNYTLQNQNKYRNKLIPNLFKSLIKKEIFSWELIFEGFSN
ncbi:hypothetical protein QO206_02980 [Leeuwenhoekiella aequorea]|uniref:hypothetical protein n=1 Tax=Leeuwenhoekiella aequorea TaxID=283736 RepID=UPI00352C16BF